MALPLFLEETVNLLSHPGAAHASQMVFQLRRPHLQCSHNSQTMLLPHRLPTERRIATLPMVKSFIMERIVHSPSLLRSQQRPHITLTATLACCLCKAGWRTFWTLRVQMHC